MEWPSAGEAQLVEQYQSVRRNVCRKLARLAGQNQAPRYAPAELRATILELRPLMVRRCWRNRRHARRKD